MRRNDEQRKQMKKSPQGAALLSAEHHAARCDLRGRLLEAAEPPF